MHLKFTPKALQGHLDIPKAPKGHWGTQGTWELEHLRHSGTQKALGHSGTQGIWALRHLGNRRTLRNSGTWALEALYLAEYLSILLNWNHQKKV